MIDRRTAIGSVSAFQDKLTDAAMHVLGSGWA
jgi:superoxide dismutase